MDFKKAYKQIKSIEIEVRSYSDEGYKVRYDFERNLISWRDYYMWNNNFMKSMTGAKLNTLRERLPDTHMIEWMQGYNAGNLEKYGRCTANPSSWKIYVRFKDSSSIVSSHTKNFPKDWGKLKSIIEDTTECCFRLH